MSCLAGENAILWGKFGNVLAPTGRVIGGGLEPSLVDPFAKMDDCLDQRYGRSTHELPSQCRLLGGFGDVTLQSTYSHVTAV